MKNIPSQLLYQNFLYYFLNYQKGERSKIECFGNCLGYIKQLLLREKPEDCIKLIYHLEGFPFHDSVVEESYVYLTYTVAMIELYHDDFRNASHWAKKTIDMFDYFHPEATKREREKILSENFYYKNSLKVFKEYRRYFDWNVHSKFVWSWENQIEN